MTSKDVSRREFFQKTAIGASALMFGAATRGSAESSEQDVTLGFIGVGGLWLNNIKKRLPGTIVWRFYDAGESERPEKKLGKVYQDSHYRVGGMRRFGPGNLSFGCHPG